MMRNRSTCWAAGIMVMAVLIVSGAGLAIGADVTAQPGAAFDKAQAALGTTDARQARQIVDKAQMTLENFSTATQMNAFRDLLRDAKAVFVAPSLMKFAFIFGGLGGNGVVMVRDEKTRQWSQPAFYTVGGASIGFQIGGESSEVVLLAMTERGVSSLLSSSFKLGADASIAAGPVGMGASAATINVSGDILSFARAKGVFAGISLDGSIMKVRNGMNHSYYNAQVTPIDILIKRTASNPHSRPLVAEVSKDTRVAERRDGRAS